MKNIRFLTAAGAALGFPAALIGMASAEGRRESAFLASPAASLEMAKRTTPGAQTARTVYKSRDGLFHVEGRAGNGTAGFIVDTGATTIVLTPGDAIRLGARISARPQVKLETVGGQAGMRWAQLPRLVVAGHIIENVDAAIVDQGLATSLLGQNALAQLPAMRLSGNRLTFES